MQKYIIGLDGQNHFFGGAITFYFEKLEYKFIMRLEGEILINGFFCIKGNIQEGAC